MSTSEPLPIEIDDRQLADFDIQFEVWESEQIRLIQSELQEWMFAQIFLNQ